MFYANTPVGIYFDKYSYPDQPDSLVMEDDFIQVVPNQQVNLDEINGIVEKVSGKLIKIMEDQIKEAQQLK